MIFGISVPIRGLFNLTKEQKANKTSKTAQLFPSPLGDYLI